MSAYNQPAPDEEVAILQLARERGLAPDRLSPAQYRQLRKDIRTKAQLIRDGLRMAQARTLKRLGVGRLPLTIINNNKHVCQQCPHFAALTDGTFACHICHCMGQDLLNKWGGIQYKCPLPTPRWDNTSLSSTDIEVAHANDSSAAERSAD